jgi:ABC-type lipoprotein export system ATPase subunit
MSKLFTESQPPIIRVNQVCKSYDQGKVTVLNGISLQIPSASITALWGASGSGKSTLLHLIGGLDLPDSGTLEVAGLNPCLRSDRLKLRREIVGFVFQLHNLIADLTLEENCLIPAMATGMPTAEAQNRMRHLTERLKIDHRRSHSIQNLSGGERQRTAICRALMHQPQILLADEPTGSLDESTGEEVFKLLIELAREEGVCVLLATHERRFAEACDQIYRVRDGRLHTA